MQRSWVLLSCRSSASLHPSPLWRQCSSGGCGSGSSNIDKFAQILSQGRSNAVNAPSSDFFDGRFVGGNPNMDPSILQGMHQTLSQSLTPEMRESMRAMMEGLQRGDGLPQMGMMAFGVGENERGKKVVRGAKLAFDPSTGKFSKDFKETQVEEDDPMLPKETVEDYSTEGAIEVEFEEDAMRGAGGKSETINEAEVQVEGAPRTTHKEA